MNKLRKIAAVNSAIKLLNELKEFDCDHDKVKKLICLCLNVEEHKEHLNNYLKQIDNIKITKFKHDRHTKSYYKEDAIGVVFLIDYTARLKVEKITGKEKKKKVEKIEKLVDVTNATLEIILTPEKQACKVDIKGKFRPVLHQIAELYNLAKKDVVFEPLKPIVKESKDKTNKSKKQ